MMAFLSLLFALSAVQTPQTGTAVIEGVVTRSGSVQPIDGVRIAIWSETGLDFETTADGAGHYFFADLPAGKYSLQAVRPGFTPAPDSQPTSVRMMLEDGQRLRRDLSLIELGRIHGRIVDEDREPLPGVSIELLLVTIGDDARTVWRRVATVLTDAEGEYRADNLASGEYYVRAQGSAGTAVTYFPGTTDVRTAVRIDLKDGGEKTATFLIPPAGIFRITGEVVVPLPRLIEEVLVYAIPHVSGIPVESVAAADPFPVGDDGAARFEIPGLVPGTYDLFAVGPPDRLAKTSIELQESDVRDVRLQLLPSVSVTGRLTLSDGGGEPIKIDVPGLGGWVDLTLGSITTPIEVALRRREEFVAGFSPVPFIGVSGDKFQWIAPAGLYDVWVREPGVSTLYVADVHVDGRSVRDEGIPVALGMGSVEVVLGRDGGTIQGAILNPRKAPALVVLAPQSSRQDPTLFRSVNLADPAQPFSFGAVAPGLYSLFAFEVSAAGELVPFRDTGFLSLYQHQGVLVTVQAGGLAGPIRVPLVSR